MPGPSISKLTPIQRCQVEALKTKVCQLEAKLEAKIETEIEKAIEELTGGGDFPFKKPSFNQVKHNNLTRRLSVSLLH